MLRTFICREEKLCLGSKQTLVAKIYYFCVLNRNTSIMSNIKIGDKIRFLNTTGGGIVRRFQGKDQVLVEDEDGFEVPALIRECVVVGSEEKQTQSSQRSPIPQVTAPKAPAPPAAPEAAKDAKPEEKKEDAAKKLDAKAIVDTEKSAAPSRLYLVLAAVSLILMIGTAVITTVQYLNICQGQKIELPGLPNK